jgi:hypothetical protein
MKHGGRWTLWLCLSGALGATLLLWWTAEWIERRPLPPTGGMWWPVRQVLAVPMFGQGDPAWGADPLGPTSDSLAAVGCAVASAAMVLAAHGVDTDPGRLNRFLSERPGGYTPQGWIYWEEAAQKDPALAEQLLPHYEDDPSFALIDWNLMRGNPVIIRLRYPSGITHFVVIVGKQGFDYLIQDPAVPERGIYPLREWGGPIEALRFYRRPTGRTAKEGAAI